MPIHAPVPKAASLGAARAAALRAVCVVGVAVVWNGDALPVPAKMLWYCDCDWKCRWRTYHYYSFACNYKILFARTFFTWIYSERGRTIVMRRKRDHESAEPLNHRRAEFYLFWCNICRHPKHDEHYLITKYLGKYKVNLILHTIYLCTHYLHVWRLSTSGIELK